MSNTHARIAGLDGVRALCVMLVFAEHFVRGDLHLGSLGVNVFFALSGFLIVGILHGQRVKVDLGHSTPAQELRSFWISRSLCIFPIYFLVLSLVVVVLLAQGRSLKTDGLHYYFAFLGNYYIQHVSHVWGGISHLWSLSVEQHFYMLASPLLLWIAAARHQAVVLALLTLAMASALSDFARFDTVPKPYLPDLPFFAFMACGGSLALARTAGHRMPPALVLSIIFIVGVLLYADALSRALAITSPGAIRGLRELGALLICFSVLAYLPAAQEGWLVRALGFPPLRYLGTISYGFYVYHFFLPAFSRYADQLPWLPHARWALIVAQFLATCAIAALSWEFLERRLMKLKQRPHSRSEASPVGAAAS
ncbi:Peptidoglycan/LPS O-acetylase OafA/YrhL, contains acyltransferase and SGNH-hydrolase domains [Roseateles sp. YR242]|uniref:acyltransferase family protein n=1 Tax=Roseateles sp. YR242 TaxID=1855305 RepID=UPI0008CB5560|nr:acyltransferase [Roseateles sp. YR242]SEL85744.1 Peptidoglycan/LPS O-acetylase OafA/YrhL, contains acyltransferase and SGNH-hydrolase domains [Roseateles sp. YR242]